MKYFKIESENFLTAIILKKKKYLILLRAVSDALSYCYPRIVTICTINKQVIWMSHICP